MNEVSRASAASDSAARKEQLLVTASELFGEKGFEGASIRDIAVAAGVNIGSIYNFFGDKRGLHAAVVDRAYARLHDYVDKVQVAQADPERDLRTVLGAISRFFLEQPQAHRVILQEMMANSAHIETAIESHLSRTRAILIGVIEQGKRKGLFCDVDSAVFAFGLINAVFSFFTSKSLFLKLFPDRSPAHLFEANLPFPIFEIVVRGLRARA